MRKRRFVLLATMSMKILLTTGSISRLSMVSSISTTNASIAAEYCSGTVPSKNILNVTTRMRPSLELNKVVYKVAKMKNLMRKLKNLSIKVLTSIEESFTVSKFVCLLFDLMKKQTLLTFLDTVIH